MYNGQKHYIKFLGLRILKIKAITKDYLEVYLFFIPLFTVKTSSRKTNINLLFIQKVYDYIKKCIRKRVYQKHKNDIRKNFQNGKKLKICLLTSRPGLWNFDYLYNLLNKDPRFEVIIFIMPDAAYGINTEKDYMEKAYKELTEKGYHPIKGLDTETMQYVDLRKDYNPDIIYFIDFFAPHFRPQYYITNFLDKITFLSDYGFSVMNDKYTCTHELNRLVDRYFRVSDIHKKMAQKLMKNKGKNVVVTGSPKLDPIFDKSYIVNNLWKPQRKPKKRIIWAPHHSRDEKKADQWAMDSFFELYDFMFDVAQRYKDDIQIAFRPHPILKFKLQQFYWGEEKRQQYYNKWAELENGQLSEIDNFIDLFIKSDAMIMDCLSFMAEYTAFDKPLFFTKTNTCITNFNEFGNELNKFFYKPQNDLKEDIIKFIENVVLEGNDYYSKQRHKFVEQYFGKINGNMASENIYNEIIKFLEKGEIK